MSEPGGSPEAERQVSRMEAAGVEPASERPVAAELYMRSRPCCFASGIKERRKHPTLARLCLASSLPDDRTRPAG